MTTFILKNGLELELKKVSQDRIRTLFSDQGFGPLFRNPEKLQQAGAVAAIGKKMSPAQMMRVSSASVKLFNYCMGWGVETNPPGNDLDELRELGFGVDSPRIARVNWLRYTQLEDEAEAGLLIGAIMEYSFADDAPAGPVDEEAQLKARLAELEAQKLTDGS